MVRWPLGPTDLDNLVLVCYWHHKLVHEHRWVVKLVPDGNAVWFRPDGRPYDPGHGVMQDRASPRLMSTEPSRRSEESAASRCARS
jgi:hypothetical protein